MHKITVYLIMVGIVFLIAGGCLAMSSWKNADNIEFLKSYGWEVKKHPIEKEEVTIPEKFDDVYENYNKLQIEAGLDLSDFCGKKGIRYTYEVTNYPVKVKSTVRANIIIIDNTPVAGDIMTTDLDGFMYSLNSKIM